MTARSYSLEALAKLLLTSSVSGYYCFDLTNRLFENCIFIFTYYLITVLILWGFGVLGFCGFSVVCDVWEGQFGVSIDGGTTW